MKIAVGCDPNAAEFKKQIIPVIESLGHEVEDFGSNDTIYANVAMRVGEDLVTDIYQAQREHHYVRRILHRN